MPSTLFRPSFSFVVGSSTRSRSPSFAHSHYSTRFVVRHPSAHPSRSYRYWHPNLTRHPAPAQPLVLFPTPDGLSSAEFPLALPDRFCSQFLLGKSFLSSNADLPCDRASRFLLLSRTITSAAAEVSFESFPSSPNEMFSSPDFAILDQLYFESFSISVTFNDNSLSDR